MTILNLMLGKKRGGLEQAALDYAEALALAQLPSLTVISPTAWVEAALVAAGVPHQSLTNFGGWDRIAAWRLRRLVKKNKVTAIICHGNRALKLALLACKGEAAIIAVAHNYLTKRFTRADHCFAITTHLRDHLTQQGCTTISLMPNMVRLPTLSPRPAFRTPPIIGTMGRFVPKKGFDIYLTALGLLAARGIAFRAVLGGDGEQRPLLERLLDEHALRNHVTFSGWVGNKAEFFQSIDLFILPSRHEAFGIVLIEAMAYGVPVITSDSEGPREIAHDGVDALITPHGDAPALADAMAQLIADPARAHALAEEAKSLVAREYTMQAMAKRLQQALARYSTPHG